MNEALDFTSITTDEIPYYIMKAWNTFHSTGYDFMPVNIFQGKPGCGKTHQARIAAQEIADQMGLKLVHGNPKKGEFGYWEIQLANCSEEIIAGLPWVDKNANVQKRAVVQSFPRSGPGFVFFDEPLQAPYTQRFLAQLCTRGKLDDYYTLPEGVLIGMAGNGSRDRAGAQKMYTHFANRVCIFEVEPQVAGALANFKLPATPEVSVYLRWFEDKLTDFDPKRDGPYPTARTWDNINSLLINGYDPIKDFPAIQGYIGYNHALDFRACFAAITDLPNVEDMVNDPQSHSMAIKAMWSNNQPALCALSFVCLRRLDSPNREIDFAGNAIELFEMASMELAASYIAVAKKIDERCDDGDTILDSGAYSRFMARNANLVIN